MIAAAVVWLALAVPATLPAATDPARAAGNALTACVKHAAAMAPIDAAHAAGMADSGLVYSVTPPAKLSSMRETGYGTASFAQAPSTEGEVWAVAYDRGTCMVMVLGTDVKPVEQRLAALFAIPGTWRVEPIAQPDPGARWTQYGWQANGHQLTAQVKIQPLPQTAVKGLVMATIAPDQKKN